MQTTTKSTKSGPYPPALPPRNGDLLRSGDLSRPGGDLARPGDALPRPPGDLPLIGGGDGRPRSGGDLSRPKFRCRELRLSL